MGGLITTKDRISYLTQLKLPNWCAISLVFSTPLLYKKIQNRLLGSWGVPSALAVVFGLVFLGLIGSADEAYAASVDSASSGFWNTGATWVGGSVPANSDDITIKNEHTITINNTIRIDGSLTIESGGKLIVDDLAMLRNFNQITVNTGGSLVLEGFFDSRPGSTIINSGTISTATIGEKDFINRGTLTNFGLIDINSFSPFINRDASTLINSGIITVENDFRNLNSGTVTNSFLIEVANNFRNDNIVSNCGTITYTTFTGNPIEEFDCEILPEEESNPPEITLSSGIPGGGDVHEDPTIGKSRHGLQVVENGICINNKCWTVTADYHQDFELVEMPSDSIHTFSTTVYCHKGVEKCNYVAFGVSPYGTNINDSVWKIILQKDHHGQWTMSVSDPEGYLGDVTSTTQIVNDGKHLSVSVTVFFKKPTPGMILNVEVRDTYGGYRDFKFNDGITIGDVYAYPLIETHYEPPLEIQKLCLNENPNKRYTCAFDMVKQWTINNAEEKLEEIENDIDT